MIYYKYQNKSNPIKFIEVKRYDCGHYAWKQFLLTRNGTTCRNYNGCNIKRSHIGTWRRVSKNTMIDVLSNYNLVKVWG